MAPASVYTLPTSTVTVSSPNKVITGAVVSTIDEVRTKETSSTLIDEFTVLRRILAVTLAAAGISCVLTTCSQTPVASMV